jgi:two-component system nitrate/nitrite response regulator NarL
MAKSIRLSILGTNTLFRECLAVVLGADQRYAVLSHSADLKESPETIPASVEIVLVDLSRSRQEALQLVRDLARQEMGPKVLTIGLDRLEKDALLCMEAGARGYVPIGSSMDDLHDAIARVCRGDVAYSPDMTSLMFERLAELSGERRRQVRSHAESLTLREAEVLSYVAKGLANRDISEKLSLSTHTVKNHMHNILKKLHVKTRREAVRLALQQGLLDRRPRF